MQASKIARQLESLRKEKTPRFRERFELSYGRYVLCESQAQWDWWDGFTKALNGGHLRASEFSIRDLFEQLVPNGRELAETFSPRFGGTQHAATAWMEAAGAVTSGDFSSITGQIVYNALIEPMSDEEFVFQNLIPTVATKFSGEKIAGIARIGDKAEVVRENENYPLVGVSEDYIETPATTKRGMIVPVTKEAIFFDQTGLLLQRCGEVGHDLMISREKRAIDCLVDEGAGAVSQALGGHRYHWKGTSYGSYVDTPWDNLNGTAALVDWTDIDEAEQLLAGITDPHTGEPVALKATSLIVGPAKQLTAFRIRNASEVVVHSGGYATSGNLTETRSPNPVGGRFDIVTSRLFATRVTNANYWFYGDPKSYAKYMQNWPITVAQAPAGNSDDFDRDIVSKFKASERGAYTVVNPRVMTKAAATA